MSIDHCTVSCTCGAQRGLACRRCFAPHYEAGLHEVGLTRYDIATDREYRARSQRTTDEQAQYESDTRAVVDRLMMGFGDL